MSINLFVVSKNLCYRMIQIINGNVRVLGGVWTVK